MNNQFTKYERARILGARALQISMDAPILLKLDEKKLEELNYDSLRIAEAELDADILPISISRPLPERKEEKLKIIKTEEFNVADKPLEDKPVSTEEDTIVEEFEESGESESDTEDSSSKEEF